jgi:hypothetical protein
MEDKQERSESLSDACPLQQIVFKMAAIETAPYFAPKVKNLADSGLKYGEIGHFRIYFFSHCEIRSISYIFRTALMDPNDYIPSKFGSNWQSSLREKGFFNDYLLKYALFL